MTRSEGGRMTIPFRTSDPVAEGLAAFLRVIPYPEGNGYDGVLFVMSGTGEPVDFCFSSVETPRTALWRKRDLARRSTVELARSLMQVCSSTPLLVLTRAEEVGPDVFTSELSLGIPVCRVASTLALAVVAPDEHEEALAGGELHLFWSIAPPADGEPARRLLDRLAASDLIIEPFERAEAGLREVKTGEAGQT